MLRSLALIHPPPSPPSTSHHPPSSLHPPHSPAIHHSASTAHTLYVIPEAEPALQAPSQAQAFPSAAGSGGSPAQLRFPWSCVVWICLIGLVAPCLKHHMQNCDSRPPEGFLASAALRCPVSALDRPSLGAAPALGNAAPANATSRHSLPSAISNHTAIDMQQTRAGLLPIGSMPLPPSLIPPSLIPPSLPPFPPVAAERRCLHDS